MAIQGNFIFGDIAETKETAKVTLDYWKNNCNGQVHLGFIQPYPGSEIYNHCLREGIIKDKLNFIKNNMPHQNWLNMTKNMSDEEVLQLKQMILEHRRKYAKYIVPSKIKKDLNNPNRNRYDLLVKCPFCRETLRYRNFFLTGRFIYNDLTSCKKCHMRFHIASRLYKLALRHYQRLDFLRRKYLIIKSNILKKKL
jgi:anaerobic magnesium-protoporphyrin IX monomethyl ester cyclase